MKRIFALLFISNILFSSNAPAQAPFSYETLKFEHIQTEAIEWAKRVAELNTEERRLFANVLNCSNELSQKDLLMRAFVDSMIRTTQEITNNALGLKEQAISYAVDAKTIAAFLKLSSDYRNAYKTWKKCTSFLNEDEQTEQFTTLLTELQTIAQENIKKFLSHNNENIDEHLEKLGKSFVGMAKEIALGGATLYNLAQENKDDETEEDKKNIVKVDVSGRMAGFIQERMWHGMLLALQTSQLEQQLEKISQAVFTLYYQALCQATGDTWQKNMFVMFDQEGLIPEEQQEEALPKK